MIDNKALCPMNQLGIPADKMRLFLMSRDKNHKVAWNL